MRTNLAPASFLSPVVAEEEQRLVLFDAALVLDPQLVAHGAYAKTGAPSWPATWL